MKKMMISLMVIPALIIAFALNSVAYADSMVMHPGFPSLAMSALSFPVPVMPLNPVIDIPDVNLRQALHDITGVPNSEDIRKNDLKALTGTLTLKNKNIANAQGLQYCTGISGIDLSGNSLAALPDFAGMAKLQTLDLGKNKFISFPVGLADAPKLKRLFLNDNPLTMVGMEIAEIGTLRVVDMTSCALDYFPPGLLDLDLLELHMSHTPIGSLPDNIGELENLRILYVMDTGLKELPDSIYTLDKVEGFTLADNALTSISGKISDMTSLIELGLDGNKLESLPDSIADMPNLKYLYVGKNRLYSLPDDIGNSNLVAVFARFNRIASLPKSIGESGHLKAFDVAMNRLSSLPSNLDDRTFEYIDVEFNFLDMSTGSAARGIMDGVSAGEKRYMRQLEPVSGITAVPGLDSVQLSWEPCGSGADGNEKWEVDGYVIYDYSSGEMVKLLDVDADETQATVSGLKPETGYDLRVGVDYQLTFEGDEMDDTLRAYTAVKFMTLAAPVGTPAQSPETTAAGASPAPTSSMAVSAAPEATAVSAPEAAGGLPVGAIIAICAAGAGVLAAGAVFAIKFIKKRKAQ